MGICSLHIGLKKVIFFFFFFFFSFSFFFFFSSLGNPCPSESCETSTSRVSSSHLTSTKKKKTPRGQIIPLKPHQIGVKTFQKKGVKPIFSPHIPALKADGGVGLKGDNSNPEIYPNPAEIIPSLRGSGTGKSQLELSLFLGFPLQQCSKNTIKINY